MDINEKILQICENAKNKRVNFKEMCELIQTTISNNPETYSYKKYIDLKSNLESDKYDNYKKERNYFKDILSVFCFADSEKYFKQDNNFIFFKSDEKYFLDLLANYTTTDFRYFRNSEFEKLSSRYIIEEVDKFLLFIKAY